ncbi:MAG: hypothetical protein AAGF12_36995 [Myxococcota bacterium]
MTDDAQAFTITPPVTLLGLWSCALEIREGWVITVFCRRGAQPHAVSIEGPNGLTLRVMSGPNAGAQLIEYWDALERVIPHGPLLREVGNGLMVCGLEVVSAIEESAAAPKASRPPSVLERTVEEFMRRRRSDQFAADPADDLELAAKLVRERA